MIGALRALDRRRPSHPAIRWCSFAERRYELPTYDPQNEGRTSEVKPPASSRARVEDQQRPGLGQTWIVATVVTTATQRVPQFENRVTLGLR